MKNTLSRISSRLGLAASAVSLPPSYTPGPDRAQVRMMKQTVLARRRSVPHLGRKIYHMIMGTLCFALYAFVLTREQALWALGGIGGLCVVLDIIRLRFPAANALTLKWVGGLMRREELKRLSGNSFFVLGLLLVTFLFPKPIVLLSCLYLALGDPAAAIVGTLYGRRKIASGKSLEGALANFAVCGVVSLLLAAFHFHWTPDRALLLGLLGGLVATIAELVPMPVDDNFNIPVLSAIQLSIVFALLGA